MVSCCALKKCLSFFSSCIVILFAGQAMLSCQSQERENLPKQVDFNYHIKPILVQKCYLCHGPDPSSREAGLRLDLAEGATKLLESGLSAIVPGSAAKSALVHRITESDPELKMPPPASKLELTAVEIELLKKWINQGAVYEPHWSFIPPVVSAALPSDESLSSQIDLHLNQKMDSKGLKPGAPASKYQLIRRLSYVLTGLPPEPERVHAFVADERDEAFELLVDEFLNSPAFGEKWASHWMDVVRYAETRGHEFDFEIQGAWRFRDYLIRAINSDVSYAQLVREQLAGDLIQEPRLHPETGANESVLGTLFLTMTEGTHSPVDTKKDEADRIDNMADVIGKSFQGLTVGCAKCHDHKFDPIPATDYYGLYGVLGSTRFSPIPVGNYQQKAATMQEVHRLKKELREMIANSWEESTRDSVPVLLASRQGAVAASRDGGEALGKVIGDFRGSDFDGWKADGWAFGEGTTLGDPQLDPKTGRLIALKEGLASSRKLGTGIFGALRSPNFSIDRRYLAVRARGTGGSIRIIMDNFQLISYPIYGGLDQKVNDEEWQNYVFDLGDWQGHDAYIELLPGSFIRHTYHQDPEAYIEVAYATASDEEWFQPESPPGYYSPANLIPVAVDLWKAGKSTATDINLLNGQLESGKLKRRFPDEVKTQLTMDLLLAQVRDSLFIQGVSEGFARESPVFIRGNHLEPDSKPAPRSFLSAILDWQQPIRDAGSGRKEMVETILHPDNPLTARVMVNRLWHHVFGKGLVETVDNFGLQGKLPSHPELLDRLALAFREEDWSVKSMIKSMVLTEAFRRGTADVNEERDPENTYLAHYPVRRLEAEAIRDGLLQVSGSLDRRMFGPPVPVHLTEFMQGRGRPAKSGPLDGDGRRSVYLEVRRNFLDRMMTTFDRPTPFTTFGNRDETNVPAQSLFLMNDPFVAQQAELFAKRLLQGAHRSTDERIQEAYFRAFSRPPSAAEVEQGKAFLQEASRSVGIDPAAGDLPAWKEYCHALFNTKAFIYLL
ncbi:Planctomycete cytochrome C [Cyclobacterium xiamenense]|uniref:Planctomycete cytochrome C n=1 Tax=Cyclobacterium xiamenense TaxID=1297121 RepID=A0A1H6UNV2_9BACT|nr:PSD1 and planctomycete cytochrome C domain-containing protein [Cyclobacterium xiamenense]SEI93396.1 Planctomycete cytochrome C [Cyclobacterium xiamenense]